MGRKEKQKAKVIEHEEYDELNDDGASTPILVFSSDDEEANQDLTLKIVEKALRTRAAKLAPNDDVLGGGVVSTDSSSHQPEIAEALNDAVLDGPSGIDASESEVMEKKKTLLKVESGDQSVILAAEEETLETIRTAENDKSVEASKVQMGDNIVLRKLLRGPRYFDPPDSGWGTCYNCGEEGHAAVNCTAAKRKKPCYVCGGLGHGAKQCTKAQDCFICKKGGHRAKDCPDKHRGASKSLAICLKCGNPGHEMFSCKNDYSVDDLEEIQCYVCKRFGHLCCVNKTDDATPREISCYKCGQLGHTGLACSRLRGETTGAATPGSCFKCGEEGHFARECTGFIKACSRFRGETTGAATPGSCYKCGEEGHFARECTGFIKACSKLQGETTGSSTPSSCYKCGREGHFARECTSYIKAGKRTRELSNTKSERSHKENDYMGCRSAPHDMGKTRKKKRPLAEERGFTTPKKSKSRGGWMVEHPTEERGFATPNKSKSRGGWMTEHPGEFSPSNSKRNNWRSPGTQSKSRGGWMTEHPGEFSTSKSKRNNWRSPGTPSARSTKIHSFSGGSHTPSSKTSKMWKDHAGTSRSQVSAKGHHHGFSASRFSNSSCDGYRKSYNWW